MSEFGKTLRAAREARGLTAGQIAEQTHMMIQTVEGLENEDFSKIVAPIYGRGFVKLYCEAVGLDPKPLIDAFTKIYADRHAAPPTARIAEPADAAVPRETPTATVPTPKTTAPQTPLADEPPKSPELDFSAPQTAAPSLSRYAGKMPSDGESSLSLPFVNWRIVALVAGAFAALLCLGLVIRAIYHATMTLPEEQGQEAQPVQTPVQPAKPEQAAQPDSATRQGQPEAAQPAVRKPLPLKPFYIDSDHSTETEKAKERKK